MTLALWAPFEVADLEVSQAFYTKLGLPVVDSFPGGLVFGVGPTGRIEVVRSARTGHPAHAIEYPTWEEIDRHGGGTVFPRGHYGFVTADPDGNRLLLWSEARA